MVKMTWFETESDLQKLTGLGHDRLWDAGFNLDDWDFGIRTNKRIHKKPTKKEQEEYGYLPDDLLDDWDTEGRWLLDHMGQYCTGVRYVKLGRWHYYLAYHS